MFNIQNVFHEKNLTHFISLFFFLLFVIIILKYIRNLLESLSLYNGAITQSDVNNINDNLKENKERKEEPTIKYPTYKPVSTSYYNPIQNQAFNPSSY